MKTVRIYKDNIRENILRSLFFSDNTLFLSGSVIIAVCVFLFFHFALHMFLLGPYIMSVFLFELGFGLIATVRVDNQPLFKIIPRAIEYSIKTKHETLPKLEKTIGDFSVIDGYIRRRNELIAMYEIEPFDIALLNDEDREQFYHHIKMMLHTLPTKIQLIVRKETATARDYQKHFFSLYKQALPTRETLITSYIEDITDLLQTNKFQVVKYYAIFSTPISGKSEEQFQQATKRLFDYGSRVSSALALGQVQTRKLTKEELITYCQKEFV